MYSKSPFFRENITQHTTIPVSNVLGPGKCAIGPYIVMEFVRDPLSGYLTDVSKPRVTLSPGISMSVLRKAYSCMAEYSIRVI